MIRSFSLWTPWGKPFAVEKAMRCILAALALILVAAPASAQTTTQVSRITMLRTGWNLDSFAVVLDTAIVNPFGCTAPDGYASTKPAPGYATYYEAAKLAFL